MENLRWDYTELYVPFRRVHTETSVHFRKANTETSMHLMKANTELAMHFRRDKNKFLSCKLLAKNLHLSVSPLSHLQKSSSKNSVRMHSVKAYVMPHHTVTLQNNNMKILLFGQLNNLKVSFIVQDSAPSGSGK